MPLSLMIKWNLETQGFRCNAPEFTKIEPWVRLNPAICFTIASIGLILGSPTAFFILAGIAAIGALFPYGIGDLLYNYGIRHLLGMPPLPRTPPPRRFACVVGTLWSLAIALAFMGGYPVLAYVLGIVFLLVALPMATIHFCIASLIYQKVLKLYRA